MDTNQSVLRAEHVMQRRVFVLHPDTPVLDAVDLLLQRGFSGAPVVENGRLCGVFSERDAVTAIAAAHYEGEPQGTVGQHMRRDFAVVGPDADLYELASCFRDSPIRRLPVVDGERRLCGIVSRGDVLHALRRLYRTRPVSNYERLQVHMAQRQGHAH
ncbi:MAG: CBS domain-containing protein [Planctomycetes bacterium]|nr:CBS domain-containing protein [Planctomycetota bacterium]